MTDLRALITSPVYPDVDRLTWLHALITDYADNLPGVDPEAEATMLAEVRALLADLRTGAEAGRTLGKIKTPRKTKAVAANAEKARAARREPAACTCGRDPHKHDCPAYRRAAVAKYRANNRRKK